MFVNSNLSNSYIYDNCYLYFNGSSVYYDETLILLVDVPSTGGKAIHYFLYETTNRNDFYIYESRGGSNGVVCPYLNNMDFIIICVSDSNDNGDYDDFNYIIDSYDGGVKRDSTLNTNFGDSSQDDYRMCVFQIKNRGNMIFEREGAKVFGRDRDDFTWWSAGYVLSNWTPMYYYMDDYYSNGDDWQVEDVINYISFPAPYYD